MTAEVELDRQGQVEFSGNLYGLPDLFFTRLSSTPRHDFAPKPGLLPEPKCPSPRPQLCASSRTTGPVERHWFLPAARYADAAMLLRPVLREMTEKLMCQTATASAVLVGFRGRLEAGAWPAILNVGMTHIGTMYKCALSLFAQCLPHAPDLRCQASAGQWKGRGHFQLGELLPCAKNPCSPSKPPAPSGET